VLSFEKKDGNYQVVCEHKDKKIELRFDLLLVAVGRTPNTESLNLKHLGIKTRDNGTISANDYLQTTLPNIFVCGDVTGPYQLTHMASHQASTCAINALSPKMFPIDYSAVPWCTYTDPEVATVGETSESARQKGIDFNLTEYEVSDLDRAITEGEKRGVVRVLTKPGSDEILGATIVHSQASSSIVEFVAAIKNKSGLNSILRTIHVYPSFGEANREVASRWKLDRINTTALKYLAKYFTWKRGRA
jgi:pyruvate/2-oxoglutarate dehydrogenase complex dihydrolipoamide dehydrogenase (E3) component